MWARIRPIGRALLAVGVFYALFTGVAIVAAWVQDLVVGPHGWWRTAGRGLIGLSVPPLAAAVVVYGGLVALAGQAPTSWGMPARRAGLRGGARGVAWGIGLAAVTVLLCLAGGAQLMVRPAADESFVAVALPLMAGLTAAALLEELLFRGFPLARLGRTVGPGVAALVLAVGFAGAHVRNPDVSGIGLANIAIAALLLSAAFLSRGGLATAFGLHLGWNAGLVFGADAPVSGLRFGLPALEYAPGARAWWTGGSFGPEGGVAATLVLGAALAWWVRGAGLTWVQREREVAV